MVMLATRTKGNKLSLNKMRLELAKGFYPSKEKGSGTAVQEEGQE